MNESQRIGIDQVEAYLGEGYVIVDVRTEGEFAAGHPAGSYNVPLLRAAAGGRVENPDFVAVMKAHFAVDTPILLTCRSGNRSWTALELLENEGFTRLIELRPGWVGRRGSFGELLEPGWMQSELPQETETPGRAYADLIPT